MVYLDTHRSLYWAGKVWLLNAGLNPQEVGWNQVICLPGFKWALSTRAPDDVFVAQVLFTAYL